MGDFKLDIKGSNCDNNQLKIFWDNLNLNNFVH